MAVFFIVLLIWFTVCMWTLACNKIADLVCWVKGSPAVREWAASCRWNLETAEILGRKFFARMFSDAKSAVYRDYDWRFAHGK